MKNKKPKNFQKNIEKIIKIGIQEKVKFTLWWGDSWRFFWIFSLLSS